MTPRFQSSTPGGSQNLGVSQAHRILANKVVPLETDLTNRHVAIAKPNEVGETQAPEQFFRIASLSSEEPVEKAPIPSVTTPDPSVPKVKPNIPKSKPKFRSPAPATNFKPVDESVPQSVPQVSQPKASNETSPRSGRESKVPRDPTPPGALPPSKPLVLDSAVSKVMTYSIPIGAAKAPPPISLGPLRSSSVHSVSHRSHQGIMSSCCGFPATCIGDDTDEEELENRVNGKRRKIYQNGYEDDEASLEILRASPLRKGHRQNPPIEDRDIEAPSPSSSASEDSTEPRTKKKGIDYEIHFPRGGSDTELILVWLSPLKTSDFDDDLAGKIKENEALLPHFVPHGVAISFVPMSTSSRELKRRTKTIIDHIYQHHCLGRTRPRMVLVGEKSACPVLSEVLDHNEYVLGGVLINTPVRRPLSFNSKLSSLMKSSKPKLFLNDDEFGTERYIELSKKCKGLWNDTILVDGTCPPHQMASLIRSGFLKDIYLTGQKASRVSKHIEVVAQAHEY